MAKLSEKYVLHRFDLTAGQGKVGLAKHLSRLRATFWASIGLIQRRHQSDLCYIASDGGLGILYTFTVATLSRLLGYRAFVHHHSYAYINKRNFLMRAVVSMTPNASHIFLCDIMRRDFESQYGTVHNALILSNSAFVPPSTNIHVPSRPLVLGHLSNLTREKGLYLFLDALRQAIGQGMAVRGLLAGPVGLTEDRLAIEEACREMAGVLEYRGPLYDAAKSKFYEDCDVFIFASEHTHEAQPTVVFEALAAGCKVVSFDRGCIVNQVQKDGLIIAKSDDFVQRTLGWITSLGDDVQGDRSATVDRYTRVHVAELAKVTDWIDKL